MGIFEQEINVHTFKNEENFSDTGQRLKNISNRKLHGNYIKQTNNRSKQKLTT